MKILDNGLVDKFIGREKTCNFCKCQIKITEEDVVPKNIQVQPYGEFLIQLDLTCPKCRCQISTFINPNER